MKKTVQRFPHGIVTAPPSKSILHRAVIGAALAGCDFDISPVSDDIDTTISCMKALLADPQEPHEDGDNTIFINCSESGSTLRFLIPIALALHSGSKVSEAPLISFIGRGRLLERPMGPLLDELERNGALIWKKADSITVSGVLKAGVYELPGNISSQFITGLLFALPTLAGDSRIHLTSPLESAGYVDLTLDELAKSGIKIDRDGDDYIIAGKQKYKPREVAAEGDYSQAAFFLVAAALGRDVACAGLSLDSKQGDKQILDILQDAGFEIEISKHLRVRPCASQTSRRTVQPSPVEIDVSGIPDLVPPLAALLCLANGTSRLYNAGRLRMKESDRLEAVATELNNLGADIEINGDELIINGVQSLRGGAVDARGDHRIAMMAAVAAIRSVGTVTINGADCVSKSYPNFWTDFEVRTV